MIIDMEVSSGYKVCCLYTHLFSLFLNLISMEFKEPFMVLKISTGFGALWTSYGTAVLFDSCRMEFKEPFIASKYPLASGLFGLHMKQADAPAV